MSDTSNLAQLVTTGVITMDNARLEATGQGLRPVVDNIVWPVPAVMVFLPNGLFVNWDLYRYKHWKEWVGCFCHGSGRYQFTVIEENKHLRLGWGNEIIYFKNLKHASIWMLVMQGQIGPLSEQALMLEV